MSIDNIATRLYRLVLISKEIIYELIFDLNNVDSTLILELVQVLIAIWDHLFLIQLYYQSI